MDEVAHVMQRLRESESRRVEEVECVRAELMQSQKELNQAREHASDLATRLHDLERLHTTLDLDTASPGGGAGFGAGKLSDEQHTLRLRLAKAEAAVEKERRAAQALERLVRDGEEAVAEGRAAVAAAFELRRRCDAAEREAAAAAARASQLENVAATLPDAHARALQDLQVAEQRIAVAETAAMDLRAQCDAAARTVTKLVDENLELTERLNKQGDVVARLQDALEQGQRTPTNGLRQEMEEQPQGRVPPVWDIPGAEPLPLVSDSQHVPSNNVHAVNEEVHRVGQDPALSSATSLTNSNLPKKKVGFWAWVAGADLAE